MTKKWDIRPIRLHPGTHAKMKFLAAVKNKHLADVIGGLVDAEVERMCVSGDMMEVMANFREG